MAKLSKSVGEAGGWWTYWYKSPDGFDISFCKNKKDIPKGAHYVKHFYNERDRYILDDKGNVVWKERMGKLTPCDAGFEKKALKLQEELHRALDVSFPRKEYKTGIERTVKKRCGKKK